VQPKGEVNGFAELLQRFERNISILGRSPRTFDNYSRHIATQPTDQPRLANFKKKNYLFRFLSGIRECLANVVHLKNI